MTKIYTKEELTILTKTDIYNIIRNNGWKKAMAGYSKLRKSELIDQLVQTSIIHGNKDEQVISSPKRNPLSNRDYSDSQQCLCKRHEMLDLNAKFEEQIRKEEEELKERQRKGKEAIKKIYAEYEARHSKKDNDDDHEAEDMNSMFGSVHSNNSKIFEFKD